MSKMTHGLEDFWSKLSLTESERDVVQIDRGWLDEDRKDFSSCLGPSCSSGDITHDSTGRTNFDLCPFWVQVHGLPVGMMTDKIVIMLGETIGEIIEVVTKGIRLGYGRFLRYERLPNLSFVCGRLNHHESECDQANQMKNAGIAVHRDY
ncbi:hypothetical protein REPUB_Repub09cG0115900 [Reevesia pubescens]